MLVLSPIALSCSLGRRTPSSSPAVVVEPVATSPRPITGVYDGAVTVVADLLDSQDRVGDLLAVGARRQAAGRGANDQLPVSGCRNERGGLAEHSFRPSGAYVSRRPIRSKMSDQTPFQLASKDESKVTLRFQAPSSCAGTTRGGGAGTPPLTTSQSRATESSRSAETVSRPRPQKISSAPAPPIRRSLPARPYRTSFPARPSMTSDLTVPVRRSPCWYRRSALAAQPGRRRQRGRLR